MKITHLFLCILIWSCSLCINTYSDAEEISNEKPPLPVVTFAKSKTRLNPSFRDSLSNLSPVVVVKNVYEATRLLKKKT